MGNLISVVIDVCNNKKYINNCIENVINQTYTNLEIVIINDNTSNCVLSELCDTYKDKRIKILQKNSEDRSKNTKIAIDNTKGDFIYFVDGQDFIDDDVVEKLYNLCIDYNVPISSCETVNLFNYDYINNEIKEKVDIITGYQALNKEMLKNKDVTLLNKLIKREILETNQEDKIEKMFLGINRIAYCNQKKYFYCRNDIAI